MVSIVLGALLLVTGGLKAHGLYTDPYSQESILLTPRLLVAVIEVELLLGLWLLSGYAARAAWLAALAFFALLTAGSLYLAIEGQRSCGCFGRVEAALAESAGAHLRKGGPGFFFLVSFLRQLVPLLLPGCKLPMGQHFGTFSAFSPKSCPKLTPNIDS